MPLRCDIVTRDPTSGLYQLHVYSPFTPLSNLAKPSSYVLLLITASTDRGAVEKKSITALDGFDVLA